MRATTEELTYSRIMDGAAWRFDVVPGEAITWPLPAPHRVENQEALCVSLSMDYKAWGSRITTGAHRANGVCRRWAKRLGRWQKQDGPRAPSSGPPPSPSPGSTS